VVLGVGSAGAQKQRYSASQDEKLDYPLLVHVSHARLVRPFATAGGDQGASSYLHLDALIDGRHVELEANAAALLELGDYRGRIVTHNETKAGFFSRTYELLFADRTHLIFTEVAESEQ
jgi:hypothetical protein